MFILATNDDGIDSPGLLTLKAALDGLGAVAVIAPEHNWSAAGHTKTMHKPLRVTEVMLDDGTSAYAGSGAPSDCVALGMLGLLDRVPDLVVSGINKGPNMGQDLTYSGTVSAAMESVIAGVPAIAVSIADYEEWDFDVAAEFAVHVAALVRKRGLPSNTLLNVNVPNLSWNEIKGVEVTRLGRREYRDSLVERKDPRGRTYYWIGGDTPRGIPEPGTDIGAVADGKISVTPVHLDLTDYGLIDRLKEWHLGV